MSKIKEKVLEIIQDQFKPDIQINTEMQPSDVEGWNSLGHLQLIVRLEQELNLSFELDELIEMQSVGDIVRIVEQRQL
jgi:acyl carrier protein